MLRIRKLDLFILKQFGLLFVGTFFICQFVLMMQFLWRYVDELIGKGLSLDILAQFFWYMGVMLVPQAFPLAILLSSLIAFGNLGESSELTAIKAAGISLMQAFRPIIVFVVLIAGCSFYFQDVIGPDSHKSFGQLLISMKQKSPELEIPEGIFYDGVPNTNLYVKRKDLQTGMLYDMIIYRMNGSYEDAAIILADSGMLQSTAEKKHLVLNLYSGEWFENMRSQDMAGRATVPYRRETFVSKRLVLDFDGGFNMADVAGIASDARSKSMSRIISDIDSMEVFNDSVGRAYYAQALTGMLFLPQLDRADSLKMVRELQAGTTDVDTLLARLSPEMRANTIRSAMHTVRLNASEVNAKGDYVSLLHRKMRMHQIEALNKITLSLTCIVFFFIGAPLGAIIRKGGLGIPVIVSVLVFIVYFIFDNSGMKMARDDNWTVWFGKLVSMMVLTPVAVFFTYKANKDSSVFNVDMYLNLLFAMLGIRMKRNIAGKEVIIDDPDYEADMAALQQISREVTAYSEENRLLRAPNPIAVFFRQGDDVAVSQINERLESVIDDLSNSRDKVLIHELNNYPVIATHAHTRPFRRKWMNVATGLVLPVGLFFYFRMWRFRLRLMRDMKVIVATNDSVVARIKTISNLKT